MTPQTTTNAANWRKSSYSADQTACVEVADWEMGATIRDTQNRELGQLGFPTQAWVSFLTEVKSGRL
ncbi:DUF397 domain-containing protein [Actinorugispora endophytica]|uniref:Uncharacterized protein DUF397 n=1 Tax=Actinorugispora endophytica TaxID=1605990 RepID=A0A4R6V620_9ACTN|nr:DUF397 domain-containing protein [Actinorugispora endophytica]TDQ54431.1 uncharacterized protein DUF397 [Actinorugispora endophytica]